MTTLRSGGAALSAGGLARRRLMSRSDVKGAKRPGPQPKQGTHARRPSVRAPKVAALATPRGGSCCGPAEPDPRMASVEVRGGGAR